ncbi:MAG: hypothetical protein ACE5J4_00645 [Candidatus Aenigmatarchaeota archaeon]
MSVSELRSVTKTIKRDEEELTHNYIVIELEHDLYKNNNDAIFPIPPKNMIDLETIIEGQISSVSSILDSYNLRDIGKPEFSDSINFKYSRGLF